jgi:hypothetical protein
MVKIKEMNGKLIVWSEYNSNLPAAARKLAGRWDNKEKAWVFSSEMETEVEKIYIKYYGHFRDSVETVTILCNCDEKYEVSRAPLQLHGRVIAEARGRDSGAKVGKGVAVLNGGFYSSGSSQYWNTVVKSGTVFKVLDYPRPLAEKLLKDTKWCTSVEICPPKKETTLKDLEDEKDKLLKKLAKINDKLKKKRKSLPSQED